MAQSNSNLIWIDLEMTGLDTQNDEIIEIATIITDGDLNLIAEGPVLAIHQPPEVLENMDPWCKKQHGKSGLTERIQRSEVTLEDAEQQTLNFIRQHVPGNKSPMCGNSICQDRRFLARSMPALERYFHYRNLDVSTLKELAKRWSPAIAKAFKKENKHEALADIYESIAELQFYREHLFNPAIFAVGDASTQETPHD